MVDFFVRHANENITEKENIDEKYHGIHLEKKMGLILCCPSACFTDSFNSFRHGLTKYKKCYLSKCFQVPGYYLVVFSGGVFSWTDF